MLKNLFGTVLGWCYNWTGSYVLSLLLFALLVQLVVMLPLGILQQRNSRKQAELRPYEYIIQKKYAGRNDKATMQKMQQELMELRQKHGYNPLSGCLPMLIQIIIIFPIYQVVIRPLEFISKLSSDVCAKLAEVFELSGSSSQIEIASKINSLSLEQLTEKLQGVVVGEGEGVVNVLEAVTNASVIPNVELFGIDLGVTPFSAFGQSYWWLIFIPLLNLGLMYLSQFISKKLTYQPAEQQQQMQGVNSMKIMMWVLPLMTMFFTFTFAAAIGIYWIFRTILSVTQQIIITKCMPHKKYTDEELKAIEKEMKNKKNDRPQRAYEGGNGTAPRSLHHIDDDE